MTPAADGPAWVVLPTYDEAENVVPMIEAVLGVADASGIAMRVLVVDDSSPDGTAALAEGVAAREPRVAVLRRAGEGGDRPRHTGPGSAGRSTRAPAWWWRWTATSPTTHGRCRG